MGRKNGKISFCVYDFMRGLGLKNSELKIYAFLYAYRKSEEGFFFGKRGFIAEACGVSMRTVERSIPSLLRKGLIEYKKDGRLTGLACCEGNIEKETCAQTPPDDELIEDIKPRYEIVELSEYVSMTREQFEALLQLVPIRELESYVARMNRMLDKNWERGAHPPKNFYRTLRKWILEDCRV